MVANLCFIIIKMKKSTHSRFVLRSSEDIEEVRKPTMRIYGVGMIARCKLLIAFVLHSLKYFDLSNFCWVGRSFFSACLIQLMGLLHLRII